VAVVVPRLPLGLAGDWADTRVGLPDGRWRSVLGGGSVAGGSRSLAELAASFPLLLLERLDG
jgi:(1->4)-alpha-D-glucan 1-alpha-D-glucosylmutase